MVNPALTSQLTFTPSQQRNALTWLVLFHLVVIAASNYLVQIPVEVFGFQNTWGAFTFPLIFLATDLTVRIFGAEQARKIIFFAMIPALIISYIISVLFYETAFQGFGALSEFSTFVARIALASFSAYVFGQVMDVFLFNRLRKLEQWWAAPLCSTVFGSIVDSILFWFIAFYKSSDPFMADNWVEIGIVDYVFKLSISLLLFLPAYRVLLGYLANKLVKS